MSELAISEAGTVQFPMVEHARAIGWAPISPERARQKRGGEAGQFFYDELEAALLKLNPGVVTPANVEAVIAKLDALAPTIEGNRDLLEWLRGNKAIYVPVDKREPIGPLIDFDAIDNNVFQVSWEWTMKPPARKANRADVVFLVNGVPVCHRRAQEPQETRRARTRHRATAPLPDRNAGTARHPRCSTSRTSSTIGTAPPGTPIPRTSCAGSRQPDETYRFAVEAFFERVDFLRMLRHWILFYVKDDELKKTVLRQHQTRAIEKVLARCADAKRKRGLVWHTQGSGKTFTLLTAARLLLEDTRRFRGATVLLIVDRLELEGQLSGWVESVIKKCGRRRSRSRRPIAGRACRNFSPPIFAASIVSMIHKFDDVPKRPLHARQCLRADRRGAPHHRRHARQLPDGGAAASDVHRLHRHADRQDRPRQGHVQDFQPGRCRGLSRQILHRRIDRGRHDPADQAPVRAEHDHGAGGAARQGVFRPRRSRGRHRHRGSQPGPRPGRPPQELSQGR